MTRDAMCPECGEGLELIGPHFDGHGNEYRCEGCEARVNIRAGSA